MSFGLWAPGNTAATCSSPYHSHSFGVELWRSERRGDADRGRGWILTLSPRGLSAAPVAEAAGADVWLPRAGPRLAEPEALPQRGVCRRGQPRGHHGAHLPGALPHRWLRGVGRQGVGNGDAG